MMFPINRVQLVIASVVFPVDVQGLLTRIVQVRAEEYTFRCFKGVEYGLYS
jgi:hypothetical protein